MYYTATGPVYIDQDLSNSKMCCQLITFIYSQVHTVPADCELVTVLGSCAHL